MVSGQSTSLLADPHANRSVSPESVWGSMTLAIGGRKWSVLFRKSDPLSLLSRMLLDSQLWRSNLYDLRWHVSDTGQSGWTFRLLASEPRCYRNAALLLRALPRPTVHGNHNRRYYSKQSGDGLFTRLRSFPRPVSSDRKRQTDHPSDRRRHSPNIPSALNLAMGTEGMVPNIRWLEMLVGLPLGWLDTNGPPLMELPDSAGSLPCLQSGTPITDTK